jgi:aspartyl-tRNA(Asn)/glutamyl-tRNA(Gln) amidotransferase subunit A
MGFSIEAANALSVHSGVDQALAKLTLAQASRLIRSRSLTPIQLTAATLRRIGSHDPKLNAFITVIGEDAMAQARELNREQASGNLRSQLHGIPIALKDNIDAAGAPTTAASNIYRHRVPREDAEVTRRLREAGAVIVGKLNLHEFAAGGTGHVSAFGTTRNPWKLDYVTGGSSSGSGGAVAGRLCFGALGTDTGGSIRIPSSWCGITGLKPTYGLVSIRGIVPLIYSLDHCGPMTRTAEDAAIMLNAIAGYDPQDPASLNHPKEDYVAALQQPTESFRLGTPEEFFVDLDSEVADAVEAAIGVICSLTSGVSSRNRMPDCEDFLLFIAETHCFHEEFMRVSSHLYQVETRLFLTKFKAPSVFQYIRARDRLIELRRSVESAFQDFDLVVFPTQRVLPFTIERAIASGQRAVAVEGIPPQEWITIANTYQFNMYGLPALTLPCGFSREGLPIGLTIAGPRLSEGKILALAAAYQKATDWHLWMPPVETAHPEPPLSA